MAPTPRKGQGPQAEPTPERMAKLGENWVAGDTVGKITVLSPLEQLHRKGPERGITNEQYFIGLKFKRYWDTSRLSGALQSPDPNRVFATDSNFDHAAKSEWQEQCRRRVAQARDVAGPVGYKALEMAVGEEISLVLTGVALSWGNPPQARAAAQERIRAALEALCRVW